MKNQIPRFLSQSWQFAVSMLCRLFGGDDEFILEPPETAIHVGETTINPEHAWIEVMNPKGRKNGNGFFEFGSMAEIKAGGVLTVVRVSGEQVLVSYQSPQGQGFGLEAGNGTLFFISKLQFILMGATFREKLAEMEEKRLAVYQLLQLDSAVADSSWIPYPCSWKRSFITPDDCEKEPTHVFFRKAGSIEQVQAIVCSHHWKILEAHVKQLPFPYRIEPLSRCNFLPLILPEDAGQKALYIQPVSHTLKYGDHVIDLTAIVNEWPEDRGVVRGVNGAYVEVEYPSGQKRWKMQVNLRRAETEF